MALAIFAFLFVICHADSHPDYEPPYGEKLNPKPFQYEYGLESANSGAAFRKKETQDDQGNVIGEVVVSLPDGRIQTTNYNADFYEGYNADVKYKGTPQYPEEQYQNYNGPKFIPVHLKQRPDTLFTQEKRQRNRYKTQTLASLSQYKIPHQRNTQALQPELKSIESSEIEIGESPKTQKITFESEKINYLNNQNDLKGAEVTKTRSENFVSESEILAEKMAKVREDLKKIHKVKESTVNIHQNNANTEFFVKEKEAFHNRPLSPSKPDKMLENMKRIREDLKQNNDAITSKIPSLNPETPPLMVIKSHVMSGPKDKMVKIMKQKRNEIKKSEKLKIRLETPENQSFQKTRMPDKTEDTMKNVREDLKDVKLLKLPSSNPETPPMMIIKSHIMSKPDHLQAEKMKKEANIPKIIDINSNMKRHMSIKSHVISAPAPAESMEEIMKKIREDFQDKKKPKKVELPTMVDNLRKTNNVLKPSAKLKLKSNGPPLMSLESQINRAPEIMQLMSHVIENPKVNKLSTVKPPLDSAVVFMKKVELMKESKRKPKDSIMSVRSRVIKKSNQDTQGNVSMKTMSHVIPESLIQETVPSNEEFNKSVFGDNSPFTMFPDQENKSMNKKKNLDMDPQIKDQESRSIQLTSLNDQEMKRTEIEVQPVHQISLPQKEDNNDHQVQPFVNDDIENLAKPQPMIQYQEDQTEHPGKIKHGNAGDWIEIRDRKPVMHILLNVAKKMIREKLNHKTDFLSGIFG